MIDTVIIIPARIGSTRLLNKAILEINGLTMIERVILQAKKIKNVDIILATDSEEIAFFGKKQNIKTIITDSNLPSGTDRSYDALIKNQNSSFFKKIFHLFRKKYKYIVNLQGDMPNIDENLIIQAIKEIKKNNSIDIMTIASKINNYEDINNPNFVKIAIAFNENANHHKALYFSRSPIPYNADQFYKHIGIYIYKYSAMKKFISLSPSNLEKIEKLEQLRALENNISIHTIITEMEILSIDTQEDLQKACKILK